jgi:ABC-type enterobactin transport system permease subunit
MTRRLFNAIGTGALAAIAGALFGALAASVLGLSQLIAAGVAGGLLAVFVALLVYRHPRDPPTAPEA